MKKSRLTKLGSLFLGLSMALGVGAAISSKKASEAKAADAPVVKTVELCTSWSKELAYATEYTQDYSIDNFDGGKSTLTIGVKGVYRQGKANTYFQMNKKTGYFKNTTAFPGKITKIETKWDAAKGPTKCYFAEQSQASSSNDTITVTSATSVTYTPDSSKNYYYFNLDVSTGSGSAKMTSCVVYYQESTTPIVTKNLESISVTKQPDKTEYTVGDTLDTTGLVVTGTYDDESTDNITSGCTFSPETLNTVGENVTITVTHTASLLTTNFNVKVNDKVRQTLPYTLNISDGSLSNDWTGNGETFATSYYALKATGANVSASKLFAAQSAIRVTVTGVCNGTTTDSLVTVYALDDSDNTISNATGTYVPTKASASSASAVENAATDKSVLLTGSNITGVKIELTEKGHNYVLVSIKIEAAIKYGISFNLDGGTGSVPSDLEAYAGDKINLPSAPTKTNYDFKGWSDGTNTYAAGSEFTIPNSAVTFTAIWELHVELDSISVSLSDNETFYIGDTFVSKTVTAHYTDSSTKEVTANFSGYDMSQAGTQTVTVTYTEGGITKTTTYNIEVLVDTVVSIELGGSVSGTKSNGWNLDDVTLTATYVHSGAKNVEDFDKSTNTAKATVNGTYQVLVSASFGGQNTSKEYTVVVSSEGTADDPYSVVTALSKIDKLNDGSNTSEGFYVRGIIKGDVSYDTRYNSVTFNLADIGDSSKIIKAYSISKYNDGSAISDGDLSDGQEIIVFGVLIKYVKDSVVTPEIGFKSGCDAPFIVLPAIALESISIPETLDVVVGKNKTINVTFAPSNASNKNVSYVSANPSIASVDADGVVTGVKLGTTTITVTSEDGNHSDTCVVTVTEAPAQTLYSLVESVDDIEDGDYLIAFNHEGTYKVFNGTDAGHGYTVGEDGGDNTIIYNEELILITINAMDGGYSLKVNGGVNNGKYMKGTSGSNALGFNASEQLNTITISNGKATITSNTSVFRFNTDSGDSNDRFRYYKSSSTNYPLPSLYKLVESDPIQDWIDTYMHMDDYDSTLSGKGTNACLTYFGDAKDALLALGSDAISEFRTNDEYKDARDRYESWATQNGQKAYEEGALELRFALGLNGSEDSTWIIVVVAIAGLTAITGCLFYRKRRMHR